MGDGEGCDGEIIRFEERAGLDLIHAQRHGRLVAAQDNVVDQCVHAVERGAPAEDIELVDRLPAQEGGLISPPSPRIWSRCPCVSRMRGQVLEPDPRLQDLALGALAAVHQEAVFVVLDDLRRKSALCRGRRSGCAEKREFRTS
ncbi:MAG: hypothetical protein MZV64_00490 [Ignavibacteriales bacterium]|nr:hypothetical protein [Ignavibacteriales bacterium]